MIKLNENYVVTPTGAKTLIIEEGDDWNKVCELEVSLIISLYLKNLRIKPAPQITVQGKQIGKICTYKVLK